MQHEASPAPQDPSVPPATPYRASPDAARPATPEPPRRSRWKTVAGASVVAATMALLARARHPAPPGWDDVPPGLFRGNGTLVLSEPELPEATPLAPLLAADGPEHFGVVSPGEGAITLRRGESLEVRFNRPMVTAAAVNQPAHDIPLVFDPAVRGTARWTSRSSISFTPEAAAWATSHESALSLSSSLQSLGGEALSDETPRTVVFDARSRLVQSLTDNRIASGMPARFAFDGPVDLPTFQRQVMGYEVGGGQRPLDLSVSAAGLDEHQRPVVAVALARTLEPGARFALAFSPAIYVPYEGADSPGVFSFNVMPRPRVEGVDCPEDAESPDGCAFSNDTPGQVVDIRDTLRLYTTTSVRAPVAPGAVSVSPALANLRVESRHNVLVVQGEWVPDQVYEVRVAGLTDTQGNPLLPAHPLAVRSRGLEPSVQSATGRLTYENAGEASLPFAAVHAEHGRIWYAEVPEGREADAVLGAHAPATASHQDTFSWRSTALADRVPAMRPNRWARGRLALDTGDLAAPMALVAFDAYGDTEHAAQTPVFVQRSRLAISAQKLPGAVMVWITRVDDGQPVAGAHIETFDAPSHSLGRAVTDANGLATLPAVDGTVAIVARDGSDRAVMALDTRTAVLPGALGIAQGEDGGAVNHPIAMVFIDRGAVRPGETVRVKTVVRTVQGETMRVPRRQPMRIEIRSSDQEIDHAVVRMSAFGTGDAMFTLPRSVGAGEYVAMVRNAHDNTVLGQTTFRVADYRPPSARVDITLAAPTALDGDTVHAHVQGTYLFGAPVGGGTARWSLTRGGEVTMPTRWSQYTFTAADAATRAAVIESGAATLDATGAMDLSSRVTAAAPQREVDDLRVTVRDASGQETSAHASLTLFPGDYEVGLRTRDPWVETGAPLDIEAVVIDHDGNPAGGRDVVARVVKEAWHTYWEWSAHGADDEAGTAGAFQPQRNQQQQEVHRCAITSSSEPAHCSWQPTAPGTYVLEVSTTDDHGHRSVASRRVYVAAPGEHPDRDPPGAPIAVTPSRRQWFVGDRARIAFECPWPEAEALVSVVRDRVLYAERRRVTSGGVTWDVPIFTDMIPNAFITVTLVRPRSNAARPMGEVDLGAPDLRFGATEITARSHAAPLTVAMTLPGDRVTPDADVPIDLTVRDGSGHGVATEVTVYAVDEGTLRLTNYTTPDPLEGLLPRRSPQFALEDLRRTLVTRVDFPALPGASGDGTDGDVDNQRDERDAFDPTPLWLPAVVTGPDGHARVTFHTPDRATQYRIMAVAMDRGSRSGSATVNLTATRPVVVRSALPRTTLEGDHFEAAAFVHNTTDHALRTTVHFTVNGEARSERAVEVPAGAEVRVSEPVDATGEHVAVRLDATAESSTATLRAEVPVLSATRHGDGSLVGAVRDRRELVIERPEGVRDAAVTLTLATHPFVGMQGALSDLVEQPWESSESAASRLLGCAALASLNEGVRGPVWSEARLRGEAERALHQLATMQTLDGGFPWWTADGDSDAYLTVHTLHALHVAAARGWNVPRALRESTRAYVQRLAENGVFSMGTGHGNDAQAYALRVLRDEGRDRTSRINVLFEQRETLTPFGLAQLALAMPAGDARRVTLVNAAARLLGTQSVGSTAYAPWFVSDARNLAALLEAAAGDESSLAVARHTATRLLDLRADTGGASWGTAHATGSALAGLAAFADRFREAASLSATVQLDGHALTAASQGEGGARFTLPSLAQGRHTLTLTGPGMFFYALDGRWTVPLTASDSVARGRAVAVHRVLENESGATIDDDRHLHLGELVRVRLYVYTEVESPSFVVLRSPNAGFDTVDGAWETSPRDAITTLLGGGDADDVIDPRVFHAMRSVEDIGRMNLGPASTRFVLNGGTRGLREYTYALRATTVGRFVLPPAEIGAMFQPAFVGRSAVTTVTVDP